LFIATYSNLENHPRVIRIRDAIGADNPNKKNKKKAEQEEQESSMVSSEPKIGIDRITGFPIVNGQIIKGNQSIHHLPKNGETPAGDEDDSDSDGDSSGISHFLGGGVLKSIFWIDPGLFFFLQQIKRFG
jgi:hypothetical protein